MFNNGNGSDGDMYGYLLNIFGIFIGLQNLIENREQSEANNIEKHNQEQEKHILSDIHYQFNKQNELLYYQNKLLNQILDILKGEK